MRLRLLLVPLVAVLPALALAGAPASGQTASPCAPGGPTPQYPPAACGLSVALSQARPGTPIPVSGSGFAPASTVAVEFRGPGATLGTAQARPDGSFATTVVLPLDATPGTHVLAATGTDPLGRARELTATITVLGVTASRGVDLPRTGAGSVVPAGVAGVALTGVGALLVLAVRRRRAA